ncbi:ABC transporter permease [Micromonospora sp. NPDC048999]|uniref:ABC transporter permease n=1 Tax=Micromonospora sp. NPDC048999 TaxID=3155391 RepID=UPI003402699E
MSTMLPAPSTWRLGLARGGVELKCFFRERDAVIFTFTLPAVLLVLLGSIFTDELRDTGVTASHIFTAGLIAGGVASTSFVNLGVGIAADRNDGTLRRLRSVPMPPAAYFVGKVILVLVASLAEVVLLLAVGALMFDLSLPTEPARWLTCAWVFVLGVTACALLGIAASSLASSSRGAGAVMNLPFLVLQFISGIFVIPITHLPDVLVQIGSVFPLKWMAQGFRSVFLPDVLTEQEPAGAWEHGRVALVLAAWCIGGLVLCLTTFRWRNRRAG